MKDNNTATAENEQRFRDWLAEQISDKGVRMFTDNAIIAYSHTLRRACYKIEPYVAGNLFIFSEAAEFDEVYDKIINSFDFEQVDKESGNGTFSAALNLYQAFLHNGNVSESLAYNASFYANNAQVSTERYSTKSSGYTTKHRDASHATSAATSAEAILKGTLEDLNIRPTTYQQDSEGTSTSARGYQRSRNLSEPAAAAQTEPAASDSPTPEPEFVQQDDRGDAYRYTEVPMTPIQKIYYGAPGTGKSYSVNQMLQKIYPSQEDRDSHCRRLIFHPTYTYEDFVGSVKPLATPDRPLDYVFVAGPLTLLLKDAFMHPYETYYLIIEEINRGNSPAIFGDLFQLLDRQASGKSSYAIQNSNLVTYFSRDPGLKNLFSEGKIWLPANFNILATMNTADENIFILDNAFKRRFSLEYVPINFDAAPPDWSKAYDIFQGTTPLINIFRDTPLEKYATELDEEGKLLRNWPTFARLTNKLMDYMNKQAIQSGNIRLARIPENKKLGVFFVGRTDLIRREAFINKVIFYLKQDVFPDSDHYLTDSFEEIFETYRNLDNDIFELIR